MSKSTYHNLLIEPVDESGDHCTGSLPSKITPDGIELVLGFPANCDDDDSKVKHSWGFKVFLNGKWERCGIWDYKGSRWSTFGPQEAFDKLFGLGA